MPAKHRSGHTWKGNCWLRAARIEAALGGPGRDSAFAGRYRRIARHRGRKKAVVVDGYDRRHTERTRRCAIEALERHGYRVTTLEPAA